MKNKPAFIIGIVAAVILDSILCWTTGNDDSHALVGWFNVVFVICILFLSSAADINNDAMLGAMIGFVINTVLVMIGAPSALPTLFVFFNVCFLIWVAVQWNKPEMSCDYQEQTPTSNTNNRTTPELPKIDNVDLLEKRLKDLDELEERVKKMM